MSGSNQSLTRPGALPTWPAASPLNPAGLVTYAHPAGDGHELYQLPVSRLGGAKSGAPTNGTQQVAGITLTTSSSTAGSWAITIASPRLSAPITATATLAGAVNTASAQGTAVRAAIAAAIAANAAAAALFASTGSAGTFSVTAVNAAADTAAFTITATKTGLADTTQAAANTAGVLGTVPDFLGQLAINGTTVYSATSLATNTWTALN